VTTLPPTTIPDSYTGRCADSLYPASYAPDALSSASYFHECVSRRRT